MASWHSTCQGYLLMVYSPSFGLYDLCSHPFMKLRLVTLVVFVVILSSLASGFIIANAAPGPGSAQTSPNEFLSDFTQAIDIIQKNYVDKVGSDKLVYSAIKGMLRTLD